MEKSLKIVTYNIQHGTKTKQIIDNILSLASQNVKIFCLQEVRLKPNKPLIVDTLLNRLGSTWKAEYILSPELFDLGLCTIWDSAEVQIQKFEKVMLPRLPKLMLYEKIFVKVRSKMEKVYNSRTQPTQRAALIGDFKFNGENLRIINVHLDWQGGFKQKSLQLQTLKKSLEAKEKFAFEVCCGDFNTLGFYKFSGRNLKKIKDHLGQEFVHAFKNKRTTSYPQMLDHIFVKNLKVLTANVHKLKGSDHFPLLAEIKI